MSPSAPVLWLYVGMWAGVAYHFHSPGAWAYICILGLIGIHVSWSFQETFSNQGKSSRVLLLNLAQIFLFSFLLRLVYLLQGESHFICSSPPLFLSWIQLMFFHLIRAVDVMDALEAYGIHWNSLKTQGYLSGTPLVAFHLIVDFFFFTSFYKLWMRLPLSPYTRQKIVKFLRNIAVLSAIFIVLGCFYTQETHFLLWMWALGCGAMAWAIPFWRKEDLEKENKKSIPAVEELSGCFILLIFCIATADQNWGSGKIIRFFLWIFPFGIGIFLLFQIGKTLRDFSLLFIAYPFILFSLFFGITSSCFYEYFPLWFSGKIDFFWFTIDHLFRAIDVLDMSQIYGWNWAGGEAKSWIMATVIVSYRFLIAMYFYTWLYRFLLLQGRGIYIGSDSLISLLEDSNISVRKKAEETIGQIQDKDRLFLMIEPLLRMKQYVLFMEICEKLEDPKTIPYLVPLAIDPYQRPRAIEILSRFSIPTAEKEISPLFQEDVSIRRAAVSAAQFLKLKGLEKEVILCLKDPDWGIRQTAAETLGMWNSEASEKFLIPLLQDPEPYVRKAAALSLGKIGGSAGLSALKDAQWDAHAGVQNAIFEAIAESKKKK